MKRILIALVAAPLLITPMLSFSVQAEETQVLTTSGSENVPNGGKGCQIVSEPCSVTK